MLNVENISFHYRGGPEVLRDISFSLEEGQFLAILGNNGAGKSTMLKCFNEILRVEGGHVWMDGEDLLALSHREVARRVAFVSQNIPSTQMTVPLGDIAETRIGRILIKKALGLEGANDEMFKRSILSLPIRNIVMNGYSQKTV